MSDMKADIANLEAAAREINLFLNHDKSEIICVDELSKSSMLSSSPSLRTVDPTKATLLGAPIGGDSSLNIVWDSKVEQLQTLGNRLTQLQAHDALCLLQNGLAIPKVLYILRTAPSFRSTVLSSFDSVLCTLLETICNTHLSNQSWIQASLPIHLGGLGIRSVTMLAPSAFLASTAGTSHIVQALLPPMTLLTTRPQEEEALRLWKSCSGSVDPPTGNATGTQKAWNRPVAVASASSLISEASPIARARLLASQQKEAGAWLTAPPLSALGLRMDNDSIRVAVGLHLGSALCIPHDCALCGAQVDETGVHALSCRKSKGRLPHHSYLNDIIKHALMAIDIPCALEPRGLFRVDGRHPDGISVLPWEQVRCLVWDAT